MALTAAEMFHNGSGVFDTLDVFIDMNILVRRMQITTGVSKTS
jgi:hypothetical protein